MSSASTDVSLLVMRFNFANLAVQSYVTGSHISADKARPVLTITCRHLHSNGSIDLVSLLQGAAVAA
jgi:hypothetical protein